MSNVSHFVKTHQAQARRRYQVNAILKDQKALDQYLEWLVDGHVQAVCEWAISAEIVTLEQDENQAPKVMSIYWFNSPAEYTRYEHEGAPKLREEGIALAQELGGIEFSRSFGWAWSVDSSHYLTNT